MSGLLVRPNIADDGALAPQLLKLWIRNAARLETEMGVVSVVVMRKVVVMVLAQNIIVREMVRNRRCIRAVMVMMKGV